MAHEKDSEHDDFETHLERLTENATKDSQWKAESQETPQSQTSETPKSAVDAVDSSQNDTNQNETLEQVRQDESLSVPDAVELLGEFTDEELAAQSKLEPAPSDINQLESLLAAQVADEKLLTTKVILVPTTATKDDVKNPGWQPIGLLETAKTAKELGLEPELLIAYSRDTYRASQLTLDQICEVMDNIEVAMQYLIRRRSAFKTVATARIKELGKSKKKQYDADINYVPSTHSEVRARAKKRESGTLSGPKKLSQATKNLIANFLTLYKTPKKVAVKMEEADQLTPEIAVYLKELEDAETQKVGDKK